MKILPVTLCAAWLGVLSAAHPHADALGQITAGEQAGSATRLVLHYRHDVIAAEITNAPLGKVLDQLARRTGMRVTVIDPAIATCPVSCSVDALPLEQAIQTILEGFSYALYRTSHTLTLFVLSTRPHLPKEAAGHSSPSPALDETRDARRGCSPPAPSETARGGVPQSLEEFRPIVLQDASSDLAAESDSTGEPLVRAASETEYNDALLRRALDAIDLEDKHLRMEAIDQLAGLEDPRATETLAQVAFGSGGLDAQSRLQAVGGLVKHAENRQFIDAVSLDALQRLAQDSDENVRSVAQDALRQMRR